MRQASTSSPSRWLRTQMPTPTSISFRFQSTVILSNDSGPRRENWGISRSLSSSFWVIHRVVKVSSWFNPFKLSSIAQGISGWQVRKKDFVSVLVSKYLAGQAAGPRVSYPTHEMLYNQLATWPRWLVQISISHPMQNSASLWQHKPMLPCHPRNPRSPSSSLIQGIASCQPRTRTWETNHL